MIFENFEIALVLLWQFQNFQKCTRAIHPKLIALPNIWLLVLSYWREILCYSCQFLLQIRSSIIIIGGPHSGGLKCPQVPRWLAHATKLNSHFTRIWFVNVGISKEVIFAKSFISERERQKKASSLGGMKILSMKVLYCPWS